jgi:hypothetical protein
MIGTRFRPTCTFVLATFDQLKPGADVRLPSFVILRVESKLSSGGFAIVVAEHSAKTLSASDSTLSRSDFITRFDDPIVEPLVIALPMIVLVELFQGQPKRFCWPSGALLYALVFGSLWSA